MRNRHEHIWEAVFFFSPIIMVAVLILVIYLMRMMGWT